MQLVHAPLQRCVLLLSVVAAMAMAGTVSVNRFFDDVGAVKHHSFHPPLLMDPRESGFEHWSFGASAVVTEQYVRLTPATNNGHGYLWNQYPSELKAWRAHFTVRVVQRPHLNSYSSAPCTGCGVGFWALTEPTRHGDAPFFGIPTHFVGLGAVIHQDGSLHLVGKGSVQDDATDLDSVSLGRCKMSISGDSVDLQMEYSAALGSVKLQYMERGAAQPTLCAHSNAAHMPPRYYLGFTASGQASSPLGYEVVAMVLAPLEGAQEKPLDLKQEEEAVKFDHSLDEKEQEFWEDNGDVDPEAKAKAEQAHSEKQAEGRPIPHHAQAQRDAHAAKQGKGAAGVDQSTQHNSDNGGSDLDNSSPNSDAKEGTGATE